MAIDPSSDLGLCLAGGGNRAFWQIGLLDELGEALRPRLAGVVGCSAGAAAAVLWAAGVVEPANDAFRALRRGVERNLDLGRLRRGERPMPHEGIYRGLLHAALGDDGVARIRDLPFPLLVLAAEPPRGLPGPASLLAGLAAYQGEKLLRPDALHPTLAPRLGFVPRLFDARACATRDELVDLVLASSATPPVTREGRFGGMRLLDGSLVDNAPAFALDGIPRVHRTLVLLTRPYPHAATGRKGQRFYVAPTAPPPAHRWDYRARAPIDETRALGRRDAAHWRDAIASFVRG